MNIPGEELRDVVDAQEQAPSKAVYERDPSLDPQLVWDGKELVPPLVVPAVPIYIQEKIHPRALIENLRDTAKAGDREPELLLFDDFNGLEADFEAKIDFYRHSVERQPHWSNRLILGDSLLVMTSLAEKEGLKGQVQTIYFDPPYGIRFGSNWQVSTRKRDVKDTRVEDVTRQPEQVRAFRDTWQMGVHSYLSYLRDRFMVMREMLTDSGSIFVQIGDDNLHLVRCLLDEVFGSENFIATIAFKKKKMPLGETYIFTTCDYVLWFGRDAKQTKFNKLFIERQGEQLDDFPYVELPDGEISSIAELDADVAATGRRFQSMDLRSSGRTESCVFPVTLNGRTYAPSGGRSWKTNRVGVDKLLMAGRIFAPANSLRVKFYLDEYPVQEISHMWMDTQGATDKVYVVQTPDKVIERCILMTTDPGNLVLDPTCGSGTTAYVAESWGRRWITVDTSRVALALARTRLMAAKYPYYLLADSPEGVRKEAELTGKVPPSHRTEGDIRKGFVYRRVPHVTLKAITNNPDIRDGMTRKEIEAAIAKHTDPEILYDKPYEDSKKIRVTGPFTVESLSPHRVLGTDEERPATEAAGQHDTADKFEAMILANLLKAGVQNTKKGERLVFTRLESHAGTWIHGRGEYAASDGKVQRVAVSIGPEHGTVGPQQVKEAAKEAVQGIGFDVLVVCGFAFDPHVSEEVKRYGGLTVLPARMNPDLAMGDELLKKTGAGNLFMVFGEPDVEIRMDGDGRIAVHLNGLDVYDPTTGQIRSSSTDDIACWFIDTDYNGESFFVRHAYFTGGDEPYEKLKRALRADVDEEAWASLYSTTSRPFARPAGGRIAVKVINHYGDEVLKVFDVLPV